jgi:hypothetical protein
MSANTRQLLAFFVFICVWSLLANAALGLHIQPLAVFAVWIVGFVWGSAYIAAGKRAADLLTKRWLQLMVGVVVVGGTIGLLLS